MSTDSSGREILEQDDPKIAVASFFAGIGGFDLGFERAGMESVWQCEIKPFCVDILEQHWSTFQE